jgi:predicted nuclease of predicted toxin-antitoxin system
MNIYDLKFLTDENIDNEVVIFIRNHGFDVLDIKEEQLWGMSDREILALSFQENRVIISQDSDFGTLIFRDQIDFFGIIYMRPGHEKIAFHIQTFKSILLANIDYSTPFILVAENVLDVVKIRYRNIFS